MPSTYYDTWQSVPEMIAGWQLSRHAREAMADRGFTREAVTAVLSDSRQTYPVEHYGRGRWLYQRDHVTAAVDRDNRGVITLLLRSYSRWNDVDARRANGLAG